jgi:hypothetical protein
MKFQAYRGSRLFQIDSVPGIYAWYFQPFVETSWSFDNVAKTFASLLNSPPQIRTTVDLRYGIRWEVSTPMALAESSQTQRKDSQLFERVSEGSPFLKDFITSNLAPAFSRPLYIGLSEDLNRRICKDHYEALSEFWEDDSFVSRYVTANQLATVGQTMHDLSIGHSFALEARVRAISPADLVVFVQPLPELLTLSDKTQSKSDLPKKLREIEKVLQWLADPVCGKS